MNNVIFQVNNVTNMLLMVLLDSVHCVRHLNGFILTLYNITSYHQQHVCMIL